MLQFHQLTYAVADRILFHNLNLIMPTGKTGLVGPNGVGKSTLAKLLTRELIPDLGSVQSNGVVVRLGQNEDRSAGTLAEYLIDLWSVQDPDAIRLAQGLELYRNCADLSGGEWMRARLAKTLSQTVDYLILDEPTNNLDREGRKFVRHFVKEHPKPMLVISHDRELLRVVDQIAELSNLGWQVYGGGFDFYWKTRTDERTRASVQLQNAKRQSASRQKERSEKLARQEKRMREGAARAPDSGIPKIILGMMKRSAQKSHAKLKNQEDHFVDSAAIEAQRIYDQQKQDPFLRLNFEASSVHEGRELVTVKALMFRYANAERHVWSEPFDLRVRGPARVRLKGPNGRGKSTLLRLLLHQNRPRSSGQSVAGECSGDIALTGTAAYLDQNYELLKSERSLIENLHPGSRFDLTELRNELAFYGFRGDQVHQKVSSLSGGELLKAALAKLFLGPSMPELLVLDEPTNNLDLQSVEVLKAALKNFRGAILIVSHDEDFIREIGITEEFEIR